MTSLPLTIDAVFEGGVFRPVTPIVLPEHERVRITLNVSRAFREWPPDTAEIYRELDEEDRRISAGMLSDLQATWPAVGDAST